MVEGFFANVEQASAQARRLPLGLDLPAAINRFLDDHNENSKPFQWVADPGKTIAAVKHGHQALDSIH